MSFQYDNPQLEFEAMRNAVLSFYSPSSDMWQRVNAGTASEYEVLRAFSQMPQMQISRSASGNTVLGYDIRTAPLPTAYADDYYDEILSQINSNSDGYGYSESGRAYNYPGYASYGGGGVGTGYNFIGGAKDASGNMLATIADKASLAVTGVNIGAKLGMAIDSAIYNANPRFWDENFPFINPQTWEDISMSEGGKSFIRTIFGIPSNGNPTAYVSADMLAYQYQMMRDLGFWGDGSERVIPPEQTTGKLWHPDGYNNPIIISSGGVKVTSGSATSATTRDITPNSGGMHFYITKAALGYMPIVTSQTAGSVHVRETRFNPSTGGIIREVEYDWSLESAPFKDVVNDGYCYIRDLLFITSSNFINASISYIELTGDAIYTSYRDAGADIEYLIEHGTIEQQSRPEGVSSLPNSTQYPPTNITGTTTSEVLEQLRQQYPQLFDGSITTATLQDDGTIKEDEYVPIPWANVDTLTDDQVVTGDTTQTDVEIAPDEFIKIPDKTTNPPDTGTGEQNPYVAPTGSASSLWAVYHPSQAELNAFGAWLWSSDFVEQLKRLFNDPMQAIIGVHKVFAPIPTGASQTIKCGYLDSGVSSPTVSSQYTEVSCGTVNCREYFGNVFDYDPHTRVSIYLPFIGVVPLKVSEVMRASITVTYGVDVITGACLAKVKVDRDGGGAILYSFGGSCACHYPISAGSYAGIISGIVTSAVGVASGIMSGNPLAAVGGVLAGARQAHTEVQHSGGFTGCAGAMGPKIPYLIITRPQTRMADDVQLYEGKPSNATQFIGDCTGFVRAVEVHFSSQAAFDDEAKEVEALLKSGVLISD